jgi:hypothetical protein
MPRFIRSSVLILRRMVAWSLRRALGASSDVERLRLASRL